MIYSLDLDTPPDLIKYIEETVSTIPKEIAQVHSHRAKSKQVTKKDVRSCITQVCNMNEENMETSASMMMMMKYIFPQKKLSLRGDVESTMENMRSLDSRRA